MLSPNYDSGLSKAVVESEMKNFWVAREEMKSSTDLSIMGPSPIIRKAGWVGKYQLEFGKS